MKRKIGVKKSSLKGSNLVRPFFFFFFFFFFLAPLLQRHRLTILYFSTREISDNISHRISSPQHPLPLSDHRRNVYHRHKIDCASIDCEIWVVKVAPEGQGDGEGEREGEGEEEGDGEIACVAVVVPPGKDLFDTEEKAVIHEAALDELDPSAKAWFENEFTPHAAKETNLLPYGDDKRYHVQALSTHPSFSSRGLARRLLKALEEKAREEGCRVGLNTTTAELV
ncbi:hypothetical protein B9479_004320 [Cryptococcus floricola]|uniref:N-acetyltransferase domain-containing protein n=1 Tax=Cryptococcus floricola TaxID=2591691 RepID=A0A5D3AXH3_9TREE|nr:hypothetical protein B9479_004320 [Cryptococcus floricola]